MDELKHKRKYFFHFTMNENIYRLQDAESSAGQGDGSKKLEDEKARPFLCVCITYTFKE